MTGLEHTIIAVLMLMVFFYTGKFIGAKVKIENAIAQTLETLEERGFILTKENDNGEKELIEVKGLDKRV